MLKYDKLFQLIIEVRGEINENYFVNIIIIFINIINILIKININFINGNYT